MNYIFFKRQSKLKHKLITSLACFWLGVEYEGYSKSSNHKTGIKNDMMRPLEVFDQRWT
jgi:hypothetical protein